MNGVDRLSAAAGRIRRTWRRSLVPRLTGRSGALLGLVVSVGLLGALFVSVDPARVMGHLRYGDPALLALAAAVYAASWPVRGARYRSILAALGYPAGLGLSTGAVFLSQAGNLVFPARAGDGVRAYVVKARRGVPYPSGAASLVVERAFDLLTLAGLSVAVLVGLAVAVPDRLGSVFGGGFVELPSGWSPGVRLAAVGGLAALATLGAASAGRVDPARLRQGVGRLAGEAVADRAAVAVSRFVGDVRRVSGSRAAVARVGAASLAIWSMDVATALLLLVAFDAPLTPGPLLVVGLLAVSAGNLAKVLPLSPSGIGLYEAVFTLVVVGLSATTAPLALGVAVVDHALKNAVTAVGGGLSAVGLNLSLGRAVEGSRAEGRQPEPGDSD